MIAYASRTGNVRHIISQLQYPSIEIQSTLSMNQPFLLFTYTDGLGSVPQIVSTFMEKNHHYCRGVIASGNSNFGRDYFCKAATTISERYSVPIIRKIELRGFPQDFDAIRTFYENQFILEAAQ